MSIAPSSSTTWGYEIYIRTTPEKLWQALGRERRRPTAGAAGEAHEQSE